MNGRRAMVRMLGWLLLWCLAIVPAAQAQPGASPSTEAEIAAQAAFDEGMKLMDEGRYTLACERLEQSLALDRGMAAQFRLAECYEKIDRFGSAYRNYLEVARAADAAGMADREALARQRADALQGKLCMLTIQVPDSVAGLPGLQVRRDGVAVPAELWGQAVPSDPGTVRVEVTAQGYDSWSTEVQLEAAGARETVQVPPLEGGAESLPGGGDEGVNGQTIAGIVLTVAGVAGMVAGVAIGLEAKPRYDDTEDDPALCGSPDGLCTDAGLEIRDNVRTQGNIATAVFVVGAAALLGGAILWIASPSGPEAAEDDVVARAGGRPKAAAVGWGVTPGGLVVRAIW